jgi:glycosyltransferase involved in cell wall biosynthesis
MAGLNVHIYPSELATESRILRLTGALARAGVFDGIEVCGLQYDDRPQEEQIDPVRRFVRLPVPNASRQVGIVRKLSIFVRWYWGVFARYRKVPIDCVNPHSVSTLPIAVLFKLTKGCRIVYEPHEIETETTTQKGLRRILAKTTERLFIGACDAVIVVHRVYAEWYARAYRGINLHVVRNLPQLPSTPVTRNSTLRDAFGIPPEHIVFLSSGSIGEGRSVDVILNAFAAAPPDRHVIFMGFGTAVPDVQAYAARHPNIHYHPAVPPTQVHHHVASADVGISLIERDSLSHYLSFPVRLGDYLAVGVPAIVSDFPAMAEVLQDHDCGWKCPVDAAGLAGLVASITRADVERKGRAALEWTAAHTWSDQERAMLGLYASLGFPSGAAVAGG